MKPIVIEKDKNGNVKITVDELKQLLDEAYNSGYLEGHKTADIHITPAYPYYPTWLNPTINVPDITVTC